LAWQANETSSSAVVNNRLPDQIFGLIHPFEATIDGRHEVVGIGGRQSDVVSDEVYLVG
jgi:hypothetical protein